jgi:hypothetical protein
MNYIRFYNKFYLLLKKASVEVYNTPFLVVVESSEHAFSFSQQQIVGC